MKNLANFLIETGELKEIPRRGWVLRNVENPESIASHIFRAAVMAWLLSGRKKGLNAEKVIKIALIHDLCEIYAGDSTPYDPLVSNDEDEKTKKLTEKWVRMSMEKKQNNYNKKKKKEEKALRRLVNDLPPEVKKDIFHFWLDYEEKTDPESNFFSQVDRLESFLQAHEYKEEDPDFPLEGWWEWAREFFDDSLSINFMEVLEVKFYEKEKNSHPDLLKLLTFFNRLYPLKKIKKEETDETIAERGYHLALTAWLLGRKREDLQMEKVLKISLLRSIDYLSDPDKILRELPEEKRKELISVKADIDEKSKEVDFIERVDPIVDRAEKARQADEKEEEVKVIAEMIEKALD